jgi:hypothetical protein
MEAAFYLPGQRRRRPTSAEYLRMPVCRPMTRFAIVCIWHKAVLQGWLSIWVLAGCSNVSLCANEMIDKQKGLGADGEQ